MNNCKYANHLDRKWLELRNISCHIVECRNPDALNDASLKFKDEQGREWDSAAYRRPCDENFNLLPDQSCWHVRSIFCNRESCKYYQEP